MNDSNLKPMLEKAIDIAKKILDLLILSIALTIPIILVLGAINAIFDIDIPIRIGGVRRGGLGTDFGLVLRLTLAFAALGAVFALLRYGVTIWNWLRSRPIIGGSVGLVLTLLIAAWLVSIFQKTPSEQLAIAIGDADTSQVQTVLDRNDFDADYLDLQLGRSVEEGKFEIAAALINEGADVNRATNYGDYSLLMSMILFGEKEAIIFLLEQGADPNQTDEFGSTPLIELINFRLAKEDVSKADGVIVAQALLSAGADPAITDDAGKTARDYAAAREYQELLTILP
ncbi:MAG: ankyrin repeat domain-containing protein [Anaerolineae bacterium]